MSLLGQPGNRAHRQTRSLFQQLSLPLGAPTDATSPLTALRGPVLSRGNGREPTSQATGRSPSALSLATA